MGSPPALIAVLALGVSLAGCGEAPSTGEWAGRVDTLASGTVVVHNPDSGWWDEEDRWRLVEELRVGAIDMPADEMFAGVNGLLLDERGRLYVLDRASQRIQLFAEDGAFIRSIGREGEGPGELGDPIGMIWAGPGRILVADPQNARYAVFDTSGAHLTSHRRPFAGYSLPWRAHVDDEGSLSEILFTGGRNALVRTDGTFTSLDTIPLPESETEQFVLTTENARMTAGVPFTSTRIEALGPDGAVWVGSTGRYRIARLGPQGDTVLVVEKQAERPPVSAEDRRRALENLEWFVRQGGDVDPSRIPDEKPFFSRFFLGETGHLWVLRTSVAEADSARLDVFDPDGRYLGAVRLPAAPSARSRFGGRYAVIASSDSLGVPYVSRYRIVRGAGGLP